MDRCVEQRFVQGLLCLRYVLDWNVNKSQVKQRALQELQEMEVREAELKQLL